ncbi:MAG TPA: ATP cone domain-containing protein, partial [Candidatus Babeliales bacterium]|nr:ATP cone domain-containing protein [Candidatus Babeliales bacterium]
MQLLNLIKKRDGALASFDEQKIFAAVLRALQATQEGDAPVAQLITQQVCEALLTSAGRAASTPEVEQVQDLVEAQLILNGLVKTAKAYILYRQKRSELRAQIGAVPAHVRALVQDSKQYFQNSLAEFVYYRTYARWIETEGRRETWIEAVDRYLDFMRENLGTKLTADEYTEIRYSILRQEAMPSMRLLQFAGPAARATQVAAYNCSFIAPQSFQDFAEILYILMCGTGVGFSVERATVAQLPTIVPQLDQAPQVYLIPDNKEGWADALAFGLQSWFNGQDVQFDFSQLRPAGARLKTMGGKSAGPEPLRNLL